MCSIKPPLLAALLWATATLVAAKPADFNLPAQPAAAALVEFSQQAGVEVLFSYQELNTVQASAVAGRLEPETALLLLLQGTGFSGTLSARGRFVVSRTPAPAKPAKAGRREAAPPEAPPPAREAGDAAVGPVIALQKVVVTPSRFGIAQERVTPNVTLTNAELATLPQLGEDLYRTIERLPGLAADDFSAKFWVRGAPNAQMLARYDGVDLIEPFHLKDYDGSLSIVDLQTIGSVDVITGGFTTDSGDRLAGVLTMETQEARRSRPVTTLGLSVTNVRGTTQGEFADGAGQWMAAVRRGYLDLALKLGNGHLGASPTYYDFSGKVAYRITPHQTLSFHLLYAGDSLTRRQRDNEPDLDSSYDSAYAWARWQGEFGDRVSGEGALSFSRLDWHRRGDGFLDGGLHRFVLHDDRRLAVWGLRQDWTVNLTAHALVRAGYEFKSGEARYDYDLLRELWVLRDGVLSTGTRTVTTALRPDGDHAAAYVAPRIQPWIRLIIEPGVRFDRHSTTGQSTWSPRLNASLALGPATSLRAAWGLYEQAQGLHELSVQDGETGFHPAERAEQRVVGLAHTLASGVSLRLEAYERLTTHVRPHWENRIEPFNVFPESLYDRVELDPTRARARGIELIAERRGNRRLGWGVSYSLANSAEQVGDRWIPVNRDQRHTFYADITFAPTRDWLLSASWTFHTGWPTSDITYSTVRLNDGSLVYTWTYSRYNSLRSPAYHRLDLRATRQFRFAHGTLRVFADLFNAYDRRNTDGYDSTAAAFVDGRLVVTKTPLKMFPILPSVGLSWEF